MLVCFEAREVENLGILKHGLEYYNRVCLMDAPATFGYKQQEGTCENARSNKDGE